MLKKNIPAFLLLIVLFVCCSLKVSAQIHLSLKQAEEKALANYGTLKAKADYAASSKISVEESKREYLPNLNFGAQQVYGTVNAQNGPSYGFGGLGVGSSGPVFNLQNNNAAFGALYLTNINWDFYAFGRAKEKIKTATALAVRDQKDLQQEVFQHQVKVAATYLNLLAARQLRHSFENNVARADTIRQNVISRVLNGLIAGVDSSQANANYASALIDLTNSKDVEEQQSNLLAQLMGIPAQEFILDTLFTARIPVQLADTLPLEKHPLLQFYQSRIDLSHSQSGYYKTLNYPAFTLVGVLQTRGTGFGNDYATKPSDFTDNYWDGIKPMRTNYLFGVGVTWNITQPLRVSQQIKAQDLVSKGLQEEYDLAGQQIKAQSQLADSRIKNALFNYHQVPQQVKAASDAFLQKSVLYRNGLTTLVEVTQALYDLVKAETNRDIVYNNVWQAWLLKAAAAGDFSLFESQL